MASHHPAQRAAFAGAERLRYDMGLRPRRRVRGALTLKVLLTMIAIVDYGAGNLASVLRAIESLGREGKITADPDDVRRAERVIFPGVGAAGATMECLRASGLDEVLRRDVFAVGKPMLGICIGVQVIFERSEEDDAACLGLLRGEVRRFPQRPGFKVPQIGWNQVRFARAHPLFAGVEDGSEFYFVNSYYPVPAAPESVLATTEYAVEFASVVGARNLVATQFHLEKSGRVGLKMLENFCGWNGE